MPITLTPNHRALAIGGAAAAILIGTFALGISTGSHAPAPAGQRSAGAQADAAVISSTGSGRITVTGTGTVTGTPNQLLLSIGVQVNAASVGSALQEADQVVTRVTGTLRSRGVAASDIQTSDLSIQPNYRDNRPDVDVGAVSAHQ